MVKKYGTFEQMLISFPPLLCRPSAAHWWTARVNVSSRGRLTWGLAISVNMAGWHMVRKIWTFLPVLVTFVWACLNFFFFRAVTGLEKRGVSCAPSVSSRAACSSQIAYSRLQEVRPGGQLSATGRDVYRTVGFWVNIAAASKHQARWKLKHTTVGLSGPGPQRGAGKSSLLEENSSMTAQPCHLRSGQSLSSQMLNFVWSKVGERVNGNIIWLVSEKK